MFAWIVDGLPVLAAGFPVAVRSPSKPPECRARSASTLERGYDWLRVRCLPSGLGLVNAVLPMCRRAGGGGRAATAAPTGSANPSAAECGKGFVNRYDR